MEASGHRSEQFCATEGCERPRYAQGLCELHYRRRLRHGDARADVPPRGTPQRCAVAGCCAPVDARGWCHGHYQRWLRTGDVAADEPLSRRKQPPVCTVEGCGRPSHAKGFCRTHTARVEATGDARDAEPVRVATGEGWINHGYRNVSVPPHLRHLTNGDTKIGEHRLVLAMHLGRPLQPDEVVHHINGVRTDNRVENLELWCAGHPKGQRIADKIRWALEVLRRYAPDQLA